MWEECGRRRRGGTFMREERRWCGPRFISARTGTRQHVDLRSTVRPVRWEFPGNGYQSGAPHSLARQPRVGGAALCIIDSVFQHAVTALQPHSR